MLNEKIIKKYEELIDNLENENLRNIYYKFLESIKNNFNTLDISKEKRYISGVLAHADISNREYNIFIELYDLLDGALSETQPHPKKGKS